MTAICKLIPIHSKNVAPIIEYIQDNYKTDIGYSMENSESDYMQKVFDYTENPLKTQFGIDDGHEELLISGVNCDVNTAVFDFDGSVDGVHFEGGKAENYSLEIGSGQFIPGFEDQMVGMNVGETRNINVTFPEEYHAENLKGKAAVFEVVLHEIKQRVVPTLTDEFVKEELEIEGVNNVEEYNAHIKEVILKDKKEASENKFADDCINLAMENATVDVPEGMIDTEVKHQVSQIERQAKMYNMPVDVLLKYSGLESLEAYKEAVRPSCLLSVKQRLVFSEIAKAEKIKVNKADVDKELKLIAKETGKTVEEVSKVYTKEALTPYILLQKAIELVKTSAVSEKAE